MKTITVKLPPELDNRLEKLARKIKKTKSVLVRLALEELLRDPKVSERLTVHEVLQDFCGAVDGTHTDLSHAKSQMDGYGR